MTDPLERFLAHLTSRNSSPGTIREYRRHAGEFLTFLSHRGVSWESPDRATVRAYLSSLADADLSASSIGGRLAAIRSMYRHAARQGWISADPMAGVRSPKRPGRLPRVLSVADAERLVEAPRGLMTGALSGRTGERAAATARRDAAILELLYATGMRISELASLTLDRVDLAQRRLRVIGKGSKERELLFGEPAALVLRGYLAEGRPVLAARAAAGTRTPVAHLFLNSSGGPLTDRGARMVVDRWVTVSQAPANTSPHTLRHSFATHLLESGYD
ncbi:MAG: tyrosine-type recombinase/integrase, partial [Chloroflexota bacterium]|nr:tyrosine-type recombinase/integrase [Chloroflexota bacterium]